MTHTKGKNLMSMHEVRRGRDGMYRVMHASNDSITINAKGKEDAVRKLLMADMGAELLEALKEIRDQYLFMDTVGRQPLHRAIVKANELIAKAEGREENNKQTNKND